jgi:hypothetical protein
MFSKSVLFGYVLDMKGKVILVLKHHSMNTWWGGVTAPHSYPQHEMDVNAQLYIMAALLPGVHIRYEVG